MCHTFPIYNIWTFPVPFPLLLSMFEPTFSSSVLEQQANAVCGDDIFCQYDIAATGRTDIGQATLESKAKQI